MVYPPIHDRGKWKSKLAMVFLIDDARELRLVIKYKHEIVNVYLIISIQKNNLTLRTRTQEFFIDVTNCLSNW